MRAQQRPVIDVASVENILPLQIDPVIGSGFRFSLFNSGKSFALYAYPHAALILGSDQDVLGRQQTACKKPLSTLPGRSQIGFNIRAQTGMTVEMTYVLTPEETKRWKDNPALRSLLVGCIDFADGNKHHHTPFVYEIDKSTPGQSAPWAPINPNTDKIEKGGLTFLIPPWFTAEPD